MKRILLTSYFSMAVFMLVNAQSKFSMGPVAGVGSSTITNNQALSSRAAANAGLSLIYSAAEHVGIGADLKYSFEGAKFTSANSNRETNLQYIRIPVKAIYFFNKFGSRLRPKLFAGPSFGFLTHATMDEGSSHVDVKQSTASFDIGLLGGAGVHYRLVKNTWFNADISYTEGLKNVYNTGENKNRNLILNVGVNFGL